MKGARENGNPAGKPLGTVPQGRRDGGPAGKLLGALDRKRGTTKGGAAKLMGGDDARGSQLCVAAVGLCHDTSGKLEVVLP